MLEPAGESPRSDTCSDQGIPRVRRRQEKTTPTPTQAGVWSHSAASMYTGMRMENRRSAEALEAAALRQQRRLKQAIRFIHRDSADLLPLDGLKKLGTSQQGQPHNILQKRLLQARLSCEGMPANSGGMLRAEDKKEDEDFVHVLCKCLGQEVKVLVDTGCKLNLMSSRTVQNLGLTALVEKNQAELNGFPFPHNVCVQGCIQELSLTIGQLRVTAAFLILALLTADMQVTDFLPQNTA
ncbi:Nuclear receptor-interacting protein 3 [Oryzias melastigma]|uniref:Nuclear receptor-interacting protein 3 n=1 Tax=Oryzias melastigma TaxID=30732 RepID=A0A834F536_ORYME|nr:Nuclear receptor-interacting protein 3 [Oryzias melastigma]